MPAIEGSKQHDRNTMHGSTLPTRSDWHNPEDVKASYPKASILKAGRVVFNIKGNDYRLIARLQYQASVLVIRFFGTHAEYDKIDAETV
jgi:mRNA interferase HigB